MSNGDADSIAQKFRDDLALAMKVARGEIKIDPAHLVGKLYSPSKDERDQLGNLRDLIVRYAQQTSHKRPLCLGVFGPPGSGKSFAVKELRTVAQKVIDEQIVALARADIAKVRENAARRSPDASGASPLTDEEEAQIKAIQGREKEQAATSVLGNPRTLNLTQMPDAAAMARALVVVLDEQRAIKTDLGKEILPIVFFDEFDAPRAGAPFDWLPWFLAPMHDGEFLHEGRVVELKRAIYIFAGGTADTMKEFSARRSEAAFRAAKGPDFVSRLRGFLDVRGPNSEGHMVRRALVLKKEIEDRTDAIHGVNRVGGTIKIDDDLLEALLCVGRYVHGARSIGAVLEMSSLTRASSSFGHKDLPEDPLLEQHADSGPLDLEAIRGTIVLSGYDHDADLTNDINVAWLTVARRLWEGGATLAYGGAVNAVLTTALAKLATELPRALHRDHTTAPVRLELFESRDAVGHPDESAVVHRSEEPGISKAEADYFKGLAVADEKSREWLEGVLRRFRRRVRLTELSVARFAIAGKTRDYNGRFPGIAEELMLTLALGKPVYIAGAFGGSAHEAGTLLGLTPHWSGEALPLSRAHYAAQPLTLLAGLDVWMRPPPWTGLPVTLDELAAFLRDHAIDGPKWPDNGLSLEDNRTLFTSDDAETIARLVVKGLKKLFDPRVGSP